MLESAESDTRPEAGPTSGMNHDCSGRRTPGQGSVHKNRSDQGSPKPRQGTARPGHGQWPAMDTVALGQAVAASGGGSGSGG